MRAALPPFLLLAAACAAPAPIRALIVDGQSNHVDGPLQTRMVRRYLEQTGLFAVDVATAPPKGEPLDAFRPDFSSYQVVVSLYNGAPWPEAARRAFADHVRAGGGFVSVHAADNAFPDWEEYNRMIGLGGWYGRNERSGPWLYVADGKLVRDPSPGPGGSHGVEHRFRVDAREPGHPILRGLPERWLHERDELYDRLRGPAENVTVLATATSSTSTGGSGREEPVLMVVRYGEGRVFHTTLGHGPYSRECAGYIVTLQRGTEWAATGHVTQPPPPDFPKADQAALRPFEERSAGALCVAFSPDAAALAAGYEDGRVRLLDPATAAPRSTLGTHSAPVTSIAFSPDGRRIVSTARSARVWSLDGTSIRSPEGWPESASFAPDGRRIALGGDGVKLWEPGAGLSPLGEAFAVRVAFSPDGSRIAAACGDGALRTWPAKGGDARIFRGHGEPADALAWKPDGLRIATGGRDGRVRIWDAETGDGLRTIEPKAGWINAVAWSPDGRRLAVAHNRLTLWDPASGALLATLTPQRERILGAAFSPDGRTLAAAGADSGVRIWPLP